MYYYYCTNHHHVRRVSDYDSALREYESLLSYYDSSHHHDGIIQIDNKIHFSGGSSFNFILRDVMRNLSVLFYQIGHLDEAIVWHTEGWKCVEEEERTTAQAMNHDDDMNDCGKDKLESMVSVVPSSV